MGRRLATVLIWKSRMVPIAKGSNTDSYTNLGKAYVQVAGYKYGASDTQSLLAGSYNFQPHEVEVFYQTYKN